jgi:hypothetical protein
VPIASQTILTSLEVYKLIDFGDTYLKVLVQKKVLNSVELDENRP